jgi:hypothetical protein
METAGPIDDINATYERLTAEELGNLAVVRGAYGSFRGARRNLLAYVSMPITTGKRFYEVLTAEGVRSAKELAEKRGKDALFELVIKPNIAEGIALADELGARGDRLYIAPSVFEAKRWRWSQDAYMALWYCVQAELAGQHYLMDGWEYSTGGVKEVIFTFLMRFGFIQRFSSGFRAEHGLDYLADLPPERKAEEFAAMREVRLFRKIQGEWMEAQLDTALWKAVRGLMDLRERGLPFEDLLPHVRRLSEIGVMAWERGIPTQNTGKDSPIYAHAVDELRSFAS